MNVCAPDWLSTLAESLEALTLPLTRTSTALLEALHAVQHASPSSIVPATTAVLDLVVELVSLLRAASVALTGVRDELRTAMTALQQLVSAQPANSDVADAPMPTLTLARILRALLEYGACVSAAQASLSFLSAVRALPIRLLAPAAPTARAAAANDVDVTYSVLDSAGTDVAALRLCAAALPPSTRLVLALPEQQQVGALAEHRPAPLPLAVEGMTPLAATTTPSAAPPASSVGSNAAAGAGATSKAATHIFQGIVNATCSEDELRSCARVLLTVASAGAMEVASHVFSAQKLGWSALSELLQFISAALLEYGACVSAAQASLSFLSAVRALPIRLLAPAAPTAR
ncbi:MAG: hypothetical protein EOO41_05585, partial [Methanobacteriota archaeon]